MNRYSLNDFESINNFWLRRVHNGFIWMVLNKSGITDKFLGTDCPQAQEAQRSYPTIFVNTKSVIIMTHGDMSFKTDTPVVHF